MVPPRSCCSVMLMIVLSLNVPDCFGLLFKWINMNHPAKDYGLKRASRRFTGFLSGD